MCPICGFRLQEGYCRFCGFHSKSFAYSFVGFLLMAVSAACVVGSIFYLLN